MPEVLVRKRTRRKTDISWKRRLVRWYDNNRPKSAIILASAIAGFAGLLVVSFGLFALSGHQGGASQAALTVPTQKIGD